jgi:hypothetical protein
MFPEKVINNPGHRIPADMVDRAMECFDWESLHCDSRVAEPLTSQPEFWKQKCVAFRGWSSTCGRGGLRCSVL